MHSAFTGLGTVINVAAIVVGSLLGMAVGHRLPDRTRWVVTDCLGLTTLLMAGLSAFKVTDPSLTSAVGAGAPVLLILGSLLFCVGPLTILGSLSDGLGKGIDQLTLKAVLDGFAAVAFASSFGIGVLLSAVSVAVVQGLLTLLGVFLGAMLPDCLLYT